VNTVDVRAPCDAASPVRRLPVVSDSLYLTFDDGPDPHWTPRVLDALARQGAHASFFVIGQLARRFPPLLREIRAGGHAVCSHGWSHLHPWTLTGKRAEREVCDGADAIAQALGVRPGWYRPPHGRMTPQLARVATAAGQRIALWSVSGVDWGPFGDAAQIVRRVAAARPGDIVLLHDGPWWQNRPAATVRALPVVLERWRGARRAPIPLPDATLVA
jgi:peptidoglycan/xylan/chitin deacetylase (PgdA/CDA1 family)